MKLLFRLAAATCAWPLLAMSRCAGDADLNFSLPPATQTGANTFGFVVDGQVWRDYGMSCSWGRSQCDSNQVRVTRYAGRTSSTYYLEAGLTTSNRSEQLGLTLSSVSQPGTYTSSGRLSPLELRFDRAEKNKGVSYWTESGLPFQVVITRLDTVNQIISGTFSGTLQGFVNTTNKLTMSDGRFDVRYRR